MIAYPINLLKIIELYMCNLLTLWYAIYTLIKMFQKKDLDVFMHERSLMCDRPY